jgi:CRISPR type III-A-associated protein Csm2
MSKDYESFKSFSEMGGAQAKSGSGSSGGGSPPYRHSGDRRGPGHGGPDPLRDYLKDGYLDKDGHLRRELFIDWPQAMITALADDKPEATKNSLRAFYSMLRMAKNQFDAHGANREGIWGDTKTQLYKLRTAAQYQRTRGVISRVCHETFLNRNIDLVLEQGTDPEKFAQNFNAFVEHFQAVIAYLPESSRR